jgi:hypothetical protein
MTKTLGQGSYLPIFSGSTLLEHSIVELRDDWSGWPKGARGTVVSDHPTCALVEFSNAEGEALGLAEIPHGVLRSLDPADKSGSTDPALQDAESAFRSN